MADSIPKSLPGWKPSPLTQQQTPVPVAIPELEPASYELLQAVSAVGGGDPVSVTALNLTGKPYIDALTVCEHYHLMERYGRGDATVLWATDLGRDAMANFRLKDAQPAIKDPAAPTGEPPAAAGKPPAAAGKGVAPRNAWFLQQWETRGDTWHKPSKVCAKWNALKLSEREAICPDAPKTVSRDVVSRGITRARHARGSKPSKPPTKRWRAARKT